MTEHLDDEQLNAYADRIRLRTAAVGGADAVREHLERCSECRERFGRIARIVSVAESMPRRVEPPADLWPSIRASLDARSATLGMAAAPLRAPSLRWSWVDRRARLMLAAAAGVVLAIALGTYASGRLRAGSRSPLGATATAPSSATARESAIAIAPASAVTTANAEDLRVEEALLAALALRRSALRPSTSAQIDSSLRVIDTAIAELEAARARDPDNAAIRQLLASSRARKLELLKQAQNAS